jgi:hypothetical protein
MPDTYDPSNWYWTVNGDETKAYSSAVGDYVPAGNTAFVAWLGRGNSPTRIASEAELGEVLAPYQLRPTAASVLDGYQDAHSRKLTLEIVAKVLFNLVNEVRALKGQSQITAQQFRAYVKGLM